MQLNFHTHFHTLSMERYKTIDPLLTVTWFEIACVRTVIKLYEMQVIAARCIDSSF